MDKRTEEIKGIVAEIEALRAWKESAMELFLKYDAIADLVPNQAIGSSKVDNLRQYFVKMRLIIAELRHACKNVVSALPVCDPGFDPVKQMCVRAIAYAESKEGES